MTALSVKFAPELSKITCTHVGRDMPKDIPIVVEAGSTVAKVKVLLSEYMNIPLNHLSVLVREPMTATLHKNTCWETSTRVIRRAELFFSLKDSAKVLDSMKPKCGNLYFVKDGMVDESYGHGKLYFAIKKCAGLPSASLIQEDSKVDSYSE